MPVLEVKNLTVQFGRNRILDSLTFEVGVGETVAIIGPNGAGKTVLFKCLLGLLPYAGEVKWAPGIKLGYVPQRLAVEADLPMSTADFFSLKTSSKTEISRVLHSVGFQGKDQLHILESRLGTLSGGQLQRILIAWALVGHPNVLLFDEPTTGVDISAEGSIYQLLHQLQDQEKLTIMLISHELQVVYRYATNVLCLNREGLCFGPPHKTLTTKALNELFGEHASVYHHQHQV